MKKILFNKLFLDVTKFFLLISLSLALIIWVVQAVNFLDYISEDGHGIKTYFLITALNLPKIFSRIIPFCLFLAIFYIINKYETKNELLIFWNIGINKIRFVNSLIYLSLIFLAGQIILNAFIVPNSQNLARDYIRSSNIDFFPNLIKEKKFIDTVSNLTIYVEKKNNQGNFENVYLKDKLDDNKSQIIYAKSGRFSNKNNKNYLILENGKFIDVDQKKITTFEFKKTEFDLSKYTTKTTTFPKVQELKTRYLLDCIKNLNLDKEYYKATKILVCNKDLEISIKEELFKRIFKPFFIPVITLIASIMIIFNKDYFNYSKSNLKLENSEFNYFSISLSSPEILIEEKNQFYSISGIIEHENTKIENDILNSFLKNQVFKDIVASSKNNFSFDLNKKFKISNLQINSAININHAILEYKNTFFKKIIPKFDNLIKFKNHKIDLNYNKKIEIIGNGKIEIDNNQDEIIYNFNNNKKISNFDLEIIFNNISLNFDYLDYVKKSGEEGVIKINFENSHKKNVINNILYKSQNLILFGKNITFDKNNYIQKFDNIKIDFKDKNKVKNNLNILRKEKEYFIKGNHFSLDKIVKNILTKNSDQSIRIFDKKPKLFNLIINKAKIDDEHNLYDLKGRILVQNNQIIDLNLDSKFDDKKKVSFTIKTLNNNKVTTFYSDLAKPFVKKFKFIKGFEEGQIDFSSSKKGNISNSILKIYDFKLKELPSLTKILTLASLQGISDLLTGEGVRFDEFEMIFSNKGNFMKIEEIYSIGPALSILMDGYVQEDDLVSLKGTLVPATTINKFVASIPVLGELLVGKKTGEGVFGVSFKVKGEPNNLKTTVNPIKTLTPRFITRTLEKIKNN